MRGRRSVSHWLEKMDPDRAADELRLAVQLANDEQAPPAKREDARRLLRLFQLLYRGLETQEKRAACAEWMGREARKILASPPPQTMPLRPPRVLFVPASPQLAGLSHAPHAPPVNRLLGHLQTMGFA
jgi:hypothetical protein